jgi:hypothetical protein
VRYNCVWGCGRHTDLNKDGFCDYSFLTQPETKVTEEAPQKDSVVAATDTTGRSAAQTGNAENAAAGKAMKQEPASGKQATGGGTGSDGQGATTQASPQEPQKVIVQDGVVLIPPQASEFVPVHDDPVYDLILVTVITLLLYFTTLILYRENIIKRIHHRKIWNLLLLLTFLVSCLFGLFLVIQINYHIAMSVYGTLLYWHVEIGIAMTLIAIIHILWHFTYFKNMLKKW